MANHPNAGNGSSSSANNNKNNSKNTNSYMAMTGSGVIKRIRTPNAADVLLGRGGGINSHVGNRVFRDWVRERKEDYNLAGSKADKTKVAKGVMDLVTNQGGRFLTKDPASSGTGNGWWMEVDELRALAKTSQALREGAPQIRAAHQGGKPESTRKRKNTNRTTSKPSAAPATSSTSRSRAAHATSAATPAAAAGSPWPQTVPGIAALNSITAPIMAGNTATSTNNENVLPSEGAGTAHRTISSGTQRALNELGRNMLVAKSLAEGQQQQQQQQQPAPPTLIRPLMSNKQFQLQQKQQQQMGEGPSLKRQRVQEPNTTGNTTNFFTAETPPLTSAPEPSEPMVVPPPLPARAPMSSLSSSMHRANSLALSDISAWGTDAAADDLLGEEDFINPFLDESDLAHLATPNPSPSADDDSNKKNNGDSTTTNNNNNKNAQPAHHRGDGMVRNVSSDEGREEYRQIVGDMMSDLPSSPLAARRNSTSSNGRFTFSSQHLNQSPCGNNRNGGGHNHHHHFRSSSTDIRDFNEELRSVMDAVHSEDDLTSPPLSGKEHPGNNGSNNSMPTLLLPWRGGALQRRYGSSGALKKSSSNGSSHRSVSIGELLNERQ